MVSGSIPFNHQQGGHALVDGSYLPTKGVIMPFVLESPCLLWNGYRLIYFSIYLQIVFHSWQYKFLFFSLRRSTAKCARFAGCLSAARRFYRSMVRLYPTRASSHWEHAYQRNANSHCTWDKYPTHWHWHMNIETRGVTGQDFWVRLRELKIIWGQFRGAIWKMSHRSG